MHPHVGHLQVLTELYKLCVPVHGDFTEAVHNGF